MNKNGAAFRLGSFVRKHRIALGLSQAEFANLTYTTQPSLVRLELNQGHRIDPDKVASFERVLGLRPGYLYLVMGGFEYLAAHLVEAHAEQEAANDDAIPAMTSGINP
ncbi:MAG: hypothetical protein JWN90_302 [Parcubacteria group bacterium]|nr:hypothetical protein [Parcubacteria group bacterium]